MSERDEPAFPEARFEYDPGGIGQGILHYSGLTKREWFAGLAMQGLIERHSGLHVEYHKHGIRFDENMLTIAVQYADALLAALSKDGG